jgi:proton-translocating NADH-quinone oxidoreductase chain M
MTLLHALLAQAQTVPGNPVAPTAPAAPAPTTPTSEFPTILLTAMLFSSLAIALIILFLPERTRDQRGRIRIMGLVGAAIPLLFTLGSLNFQVSQDFNGGTIAYEEKHAWITGFPIHATYHLGVDGVSLPLLLLSTVMFTAAVLAAWRNEVRPRLFYVLLLVLETGVNGTLCSLDYVLFMVFWGMELVPSFLLIAIWGGAGRARAAQRYLGYGLLSLALLLASFLLLAFKSKQGSFDFDLANTVTLTKGIAYAGFWLAFAAFAIRLPVVPLHAWNLDAQVEASPPVSMLLSGVSTKLGAYGLIRICLTAFPGAATRFGFVLTVLAVAGALWGAVAALGQSDLKKLIAYAGLAQVSVVLLAISTGQPIAMSGAVLMMLASGFGIGLLYALAGTLEDRARTRDLHRLGGLAVQMPRLTALWVVGGLTVAGVPFLAGFSAEYLVFTGSFPAHRWATLIVMAASILTTGYVLWMLQRAFFGPAKEAFARLKDASTLELFYLVPVAGLVLLLGLFPGRLLPVINNGVLTIVSRLTGG